MMVMMVTFFLCRVTRAMSLWFSKRVIDYHFTTVSHSFVHHRPTEIWRAVHFRSVNSRRFTLIDVGRWSVTKVLPSSFVISVQSTAFWPAGVQTWNGCVVRWPWVPSSLWVLVSNPQEYILWFILQLASKKMPACAGSVVVTRHVTSVSSHVIFLLIIFSRPGSRQSKGETENEQKNKACADL